MLAPTRPRQADHLELLKLIRPWSMRTQQKLRVGNPFDGGYVLPAAILNCDAVVSIGIGHDVSFDHVLAWNVIYHGDETIVRRTMAEVARVTRPGGSFMATMLSARRLPVEQAKAKGHEISRNTWVFDGEGDKIHPHYFCTAPELLSLLWGFEIVTLFDRPHAKPGSWHWHLLAERLA